MKLELNKQMRMLSGFLLISIVSIQFSCGTFRQMEFNRNRSLWRESGITNYRMTVDLQKTGHAAPSGKFTITVRGGKAESIKRADNPEYVLRDEMFWKYNTIEKIFDYIEIADKEEWNWDDTREIEYDSKLGYPKKVSLDRFRVFDEELFFQVLQFEVLE